MVWTCAQEVAKVYDPCLIGLDVLTAGGCKIDLGRGVTCRQDPREPADLQGSRDSLISFYFGELSVSGV